jgi:hypothetical protein
MVSFMLYAISWKQMLFFPYTWYCHPSAKEFKVSIIANVCKKKLKILCSNIVAKISDIFPFFVWKIQNLVYLGILIIWNYPNCLQSFYLEFVALLFWLVLAFPRACCQNEFRLASAQTFFFSSFQRPNICLSLPRVDLTRPEGANKRGQQHKTSYMCT